MPAANAGTRRLTETWLWALRCPPPSGRCPRFGASGRRRAPCGWRHQHGVAVADICGKGSASPSEGLLSRVGGEEEVPAAPDRRATSRRNFPKAKVGKGSPSRSLLDPPHPRLPTSSHSGAQGQASCPGRGSSPRCWGFKGKFGRSRSREGRTGCRQMLPSWGELRAWLSG